MADHSAAALAAYERAAAALAAYGRAAALAAGHHAGLDPAARLAHAHAWVGEIGRAHV